MRLLLRIAVFLLVFIHTRLFAQCPPPGFPQPGNTCPQAPILCENLDGYCATINNNNVSQSFPGCPGFVLNNDEWFAFFAGSTTITMVVTPSNCTQGGNMGLQAGIYAACPPTSGNAMDLQCSCTQNPFTLTANNFVVGQVYWMVIDGCGGNVCDYSIDVTVGSTVGVAPNNPGPVTGPVTVCAPSSTSYSLAPVPLATQYTWTLNPASAGTVVSNGTSSTINWAPGASGPVQLCVTAANGCYTNPTPSCIDINVVPRPTATISGSGQVCPGQSGSSTNLTVTFTGEGPWNFVHAINGASQPSIQTNDNPYTLTVTQPGTYTLVSVSTVTGTCTGTVTGSAVVTPITLSPATSVVNANCGLSNGDVDLSMSGGTTPYTYSWSNSETTEDLQDVPAGTYTVTVTDASGCTITRTATVGNVPINFTVNSTITPNTTCNGGNGSVTLNVTPSGAYTFEWSGGETTNALGGLPPGSYTVTVSAGGTCTQAVTINIPNQPNTPNVSAVTTPTTCALPNGSIALTVSGGVAPYTFEWPGGETTASLTGISSGAYTVTVTGANGCTTASNINLSNTNPPFTVTPTIVANTTCNGGNGSVTLSVSPSGAYTFEWGGGETTASLSGLTPGGYVVTVSAGGACTQVVNINIPDQPNTPNVSLTAVPTTCELPNGGVTLNVSGGVSPYTFLWDGGQTTQNLTAIPAGSYEVTVTGANGCTRTASVNVSNTNPPITITPTIVANTTCNGGNGSISIAIAPAGSYTINWDNGATTNSITNLPPGAYSVTVNGGGACTQTATYNVPDNPNNPNVTFTTVPSTCDLANGNINLTVSGGVSPYSFQWSNGATSQSLSGVLAGSYSVVVTGANGCTNSADINLANNNPNFNVNPNIVANTSCNANGTGAISLTVTPPPGPYTFLWSTAATTNGITNLQPGNYQVTVSAGGSCTETLDIEVPNEPNEPQLSFAVTNATCGLANGSINLTVSGGVAPYTYQWSNGQTTQDISGLVSDDYFVVVTGANGCSNTDFVNVGDNQVNININGNVVNNTSCLATGNGSIALSATPGGLTYSWSTGATTQPNNHTLQGDLTFSVSAGGTCTEEQTFTVDDAALFPDLFLEITEGVCGLPNGSIDLQVSGVPNPLTYSWSNGATTQDIGNLPANDYFVTVTTAQGCSNVAIATMTNNPLGLGLVGAVFDNTSCTLPNGNIFLDVIPEIYTYAYQWSNGANTANPGSVAAGLYTVTVTLGNCTATETFEVLSNTPPPNLSTTVNAATCGLANGSATANASGGQSPYTYRWSNNVMNATVNNLAPGIYTVTVTGSNGCTASATVTIPNNTLSFTPTATILANTSCTAGNGAIDLSVTPAGTYTYVWSNTALTQDISGLTSGVYTVTISAGPTCTATAAYTITSNTSDPVITATVTAAICGQSDGAVDITVTGAAPFTYNWSNMAVSEDITAILAGTYTVTVTAANGCTASGVFTVANNSSTFSLSGVATPLTNCAANNGAVDLVITPAGVYTIEWSNMAATEDLSNLPAGTYTVTVTQTGSCTASTSFTVNDLTSFPNLSAAQLPEICGLQNGAIDLSVSGATLPYTYTWSNSAALEDLTNIGAGTYTVTVSGANGCTATLSAAVPNNAITFTINGVPTPNSSCVSNNGGIDVSIDPGGAYTYVWSNAAVTEDLSGVLGGVYTVTVSAGGTCTSTASFAVPENTNAPSVSESITPALCGQANGAINLNVSGGVSPYQYNWSTGATTEDISALLSGVYTVTVTGANGCSAIRNITVLENVFSPSVTPASTPNTSCVLANGTAAVTVAPAGAYTYIWSGGQTTASVTGLPQGVYTVTVSAGGGCTAAANVTVGNSTPSANATASVLNALCAQAVGAIDLNASGGQSPYVYLWSNAAVSEDLAGLFPGNYTVTITAANGCTSTYSYTVGDDPFNFLVTETMTPNTSCAAPNGTLSANVLPAANYTYQWSTGATTATISNLAPGDYTVTVTFGGPCSNVATFTVANNTPSPNLASNVVNALCSQSTGQIDLTAVGGQPPYSYNWSTGATTEDINNLFSGTYTVTVSSATGCTSTGVYTVGNDSNNFSVSAAVTDNTSCAAGNGSLNQTLTPAGAYAFLWSNGALSEDISGLNPGNYSVTITDASGCAITEFYTVGNAIQAVTLSGASSNILCFGANTGAIDITVNTGTPAYNYNWSPAQPGNPQDLNNIPAGNYALTVTDILGCSATAVFSILQPAAGLSIACDQSQVVSVPGASDGAGAVDINGGTAPYTVNWSPGGTVTNNLNSGVFTIQGLAEGSYSVTVTDANGCSVQCGFNVGLVDCTTEVGTMSGNLQATCAPNCITAVYNPAGQALDPEDVLQFILHTGNSNQISGEIARNTQPVFCFDPAQMSYGATYYISAVAGNNDGNGNVILSDFCTVVSFGTPVVFNEKPEAAIAPPAALSCANVVVALQGSSSIAATVFQWSAQQGGQIIGAANQANITAGAAGLYQLITDAAGCRDTASVTVQNITNQPTATVLASPDDILDCQIDEIILAGSIEGTANANVIWLSGGQVYSNNNPVEITLPGTYEFIILDTLTFCSDTAVVTIDENLAFPPLNVATPGTLTCNQPQVTLSGGSPFPGIGFRWVQINGPDTLLIGNGPSVSVSLPGVYYLIGFDPVNGCTNIDNVTVLANQLYPIADAGTPFTIDCFGETLPLNGAASGGSGPLNYLWTTANGNIQSGNTTLTPTITLPGTYTLLVTDPANGCTDSDAVQIAPDAPVANVQVLQPPCHTDRGAIIIESVSGGAPPVRYSLNGQGFTTNPVFGQLTAGNYTLLVSDAQGCTTTAEATIVQPLPFEVSLQPVVYLRIGQSYLLEVEIDPPLSLIQSVQWEPTNGLSCDTCLLTEAAPTRTLNYEVRVTNQNGCEDRAAVLVQVDERLKIYGPNIITPDGEAPNNRFTLYTEPGFNLKIKTLQIFTRWGEMVFENTNFDPNNPELGWDGTFAGTALNPGVFVWYAVIIGPDGREIFIEGDVTVSR